MRSDGIYLSNYGEIKPVLYTYKQWKTTTSTFLVLIIINILFENFIFL